MRFGVSVWLRRRSPEESIEEVAQQALELVTFAEAAGFDIAWAGEHHLLESNAVPNPLILLTHWAAHTSRIRLGTAVIVAPYWHPLRLAGEIGLTDVLTGGRLDVGIARGAYQYEFDRLGGGIPQERGGAYVRELIPVVKKLWAGDYEHDGEIWKFPQATTAPKPLQKPHPPIWVAARDPNTYDWAVKNDLDIQATPLSKPFSEVENLAQKFETALANNPGHRRPRFMVLRTTCVYDNPADWRVPVEVMQEENRSFDGLFYNAGGVINGFPTPIDHADRIASGDYQPEAIHENLMFGTPDEVITKLRRYEALGIDQFCLSASFGLPHATAMRSLELFAKEVMPHFVEKSTHLAPSPDEHQSTVTHSL